MEIFPEWIKDDETVEELGIKGYRLIQKKKGFRFGTDAVLLSWFTGLRDRESVMDLCTGSGIIPVLFAGKSQAKRIVGLELQEKYAEMAGRSVRLNGLQDRVSILQGDVRDLDFLGKLGQFDVVSANPPYKKPGSGLLNSLTEKSIARHEITLDLAGLIQGAASILGHKGRLCLVHRPERLLDIVEGMRCHGLEPKRIRLVAPRTGQVPNLILVEGIKNQRPYLKWEPQLEIYQAQGGGYTAAIEEIYHDNRHR